MKRLGDYFPLYFDLGLMTLTWKFLDGCTPKTNFLGALELVLKISETLWPKASTLDLCIVYCARAKPFNNTAWSSFVYALLHVYLV